MVVVAAAVFNDLIGWLIFASILGMIGASSGAGFSIGTTVALTLAAAGLVLTAGTWAVNPSLPWVQAHTSWPGGVLGFAVVAALLCAALLCAALMQWSLGLRTRRTLRFADFLRPGRLQPALRSTGRREAIQELVDLACDGTGLDPQATGSLVWERERMMATGLARGIAVPHAQVAGLAAPVTAGGLSREGADFDAEDGQPARLIVLVLTPRGRPERPAGTPERHRPHLPRAARRRGGPAGVELHRVPVAAEGAHGDVSAPGP